MQSLSKLRHERDRKRTQDDGKEGGKEKKDRSNELTARNRPTPLFEVDQIRHVGLGVACEGVAIWQLCRAWGRGRGRTVGLHTGAVDRVGIARDI